MKHKWIHYKGKNYLSGPSLYRYCEICLLEQIFVDGIGNYVLNGWANTIKQNIKDPNISCLVYKMHTALE